MVRWIAMFVACVFALIAVYVLMLGGHGPVYLAAAVSAAVAFIAICVIVLKSSN